MRVSKKHLKRLQDLAELGINPLVKRSKELYKKLDELQDTFDSTKEPAPQEYLDTFLEFAFTNIALSRQRQRGIIK